MNERQEGGERAISRERNLARRGREAIRHGQTHVFVPHSSPTRNLGEVHTRRDVGHGMVVLGREVTAWISAHSSAPSRTVFGRVSGRSIAGNRR